jgi:hypothetical protein
MPVGDGTPLDQELDALAKELASLLKLSIVHILAGLSTSVYYEKALCLVGFAAAFSLAGFL